MFYKNFDELIASVSRGNGNKRRVAAAAPHTKNVMEALLRAVSEDMIDVVLVGDMRRICAACEEVISEKPEYKVLINEVTYRKSDGTANEEAGWDSSGDAVRIVQASSDVDAAYEAVRLVRNGVCDFIMKGSLETGVLLREVVNKETGIGRHGGDGSNNAGSVMFHMMLVEIPSYHKVLGVTDGGMLITPTLEQKAVIVRESAAMFRRLGAESPKIACLAAVEKVNPKMTETEDGAALKEMALAGMFGACELEGPVSTDLAFSTEAAAIKGYESSVTGDVDIVLVPNIAAGNIMVKSLVQFAGARTAGCVLGAQVPISLTSRGASADEEYNALMLAAAQA